MRNVFSVIAAAAGQQQSAPEGVEQALRQLRPPVQVEGRSYETRTVEEALRRLTVPAASIAFIDGGELVWARAFGTADSGSGRAVPLRRTH